MLQKLTITLAALAAIILVWNLHTILLVVPDELNQGAAFRIIYFHVAAVFTSFCGFYLAMGLAVLYLAKRNLRYDSMSAAVTEVSAVFATVTLITGMFWGRIIWGIWWAWDPRLISYCVCLLFCWGYLMMRKAVDDPTQRARLSAVLLIFTTLDIIIVWKSIEWWRTQHPGPVLTIRGGGGMAPGMEAPIFWNLLAMVLLATAMSLIRMRQDSMQREIDAVRRYAHAM
jgi:heme exporter protein C